MNPKKVHVTVLVGGGSRFLPLYKASQKTDSAFEITQVYTHKKESPAVDEIAPNLGIRAARWNFVRMHSETGINRTEYENQLARDILAAGPKTQIIFMTGWLLVFSKAFLKYFPYQDGLFRVLNIHPAYLPDFEEKQNQIILPDGSQSPVFRGIGSQVITDTLAAKVSYTGVTCYFVLPTVFDEDDRPTSFDVGHVLLRNWVKIDANETAENLQAKLDQKEDEIGRQALQIFAQGKLEIKKGKIKII